MSTEEKVAAPDSNGQRRHCGGQAKWMRISRLTSIWLPLDLVNADLGDARPALPHLPTEPTTPKSSVTKPPARYQPGAITPPDPGCREIAAPGHLPRASRVWPAAPSVGPDRAAKE
jgi:hypothetical protein